MCEPFLVGSPGLSVGGSQALEAYKRQAPPLLAGSDAAREEPNRHQHLLVEMALTLLLRGLKKGAFERFPGTRAESSFAVPCTVSLIPRQLSMVLPAACLLIAVCTFLRPRSPAEGFYMKSLHLEVL